MPETQELDRIQRTDVLVGPAGTPTQRMQILWQRAMERIEVLQNQVAALTQAVDDLTP